MQVAHAPARAAQERLAMAQDGAHGADLIGGTKAAAQQADGVEVLQPLAVLHVGLAPGQILAMPRVDQADFDPGGVEDLKQRNPIHAGGLHGHGGHAAVLQPVAQGVEVFGEGGKGAHGFGITAGRDSHVDFARANVYASGVRMESVQGFGRCGFCIWQIAFELRSHTVPLVKGGWRVARPAASK